MSYAAILGQVGIVIAVPIALGAWLGVKVDERAGTSPWGLLSLIALGMLVAGVGVWRLIKRYMDENPITPSTERARQAGRQWERDIEEQERRRDEERR